MRSVHQIVLCCVQRSVQLSVLLVCMELRGADYTNAGDQLATLLMAMTVINSSIQIRFDICNNNYSYLFCQAGKTLALATDVKDYYYY